MTEMSPLRRRMIDDMLNKNVVHPDQSGELDGLITTFCRRSVSTTARSSTG